MGGGGGGGGEGHGEVVKGDGERERGRSSRTGGEEEQEEKGSSSTSGVGREKVQQQRRSRKRGRTAPSLLASLPSCSIHPMQCHPMPCYPPASSPCRFLMAYAHSPLWSLWPGLHCTWPPGPGCCSLWQRRPARGPRLQCWQQGCRWSRSAGEGGQEKESEIGRGRGGWRNMSSSSEIGKEEQQR